MANLHQCAPFICTCRTDTGFVVGCCRKYESKEQWKQTSGVGTGGSGCSLNRGPRAPGASEYWGHIKFLGKTLRKIIKIITTR